MDGIGFDDIAVEGWFQLEAVRAELAQRTNERDYAREDRDNHYQRANRLFAQFESFKERVREIAIDAHKEGYFCRDGLNERLTALGLEEYAPRWTVSLRVEVELVVDGDDEQDASQKAEEALMVTYDEDVGLDMDINRIQATSVEEVDE